MQFVTKEPCRHSWRLEYLSFGVIHEVKGLRQRSLCAQLHSGILPLHLETGRYRGVIEEERICTYCDINKIENEFRFVVYCPLYHALKII